jgi:hypothetical protein
MNLEGKFTKVIKIFEWTSSHMLKIDIFYLFLTSNIELQEKFRLNTSPLAPKLM